ncbi:hypothetical protein GIB67_026016 [Kingdonia uniflora]|uniref:Uncharacterized protein n=1 Tax=Kingdonia uniflora TaxID=39325 RepID=A0A7J7M2V4_9MAGN|nr:hypothetical protein GIB67_026016 [Kingdonia uniflora]
MNKGGGVSLGGGGGVSGPTASASAAAAQKQKNLLQRVDGDISNIVDNFTLLVLNTKDCPRFKETMSWLQTNFGLPSHGAVSPILGSKFNASNIDLDHCQSKVQFLIPCIESVNYCPYAVEMLVSILQYSSMFEEVNDPPVTNSQETLLMETRGARMVQAAESLLKLVSELKQTAIFSGFASLNEHVEKRIIEFNQQSVKTEHMLARIGEEAATSLKELESHYYSSIQRSSQLHS